MSTTSLEADIIIFVFRDGERTDDTVGHTALLEKVT